MSGPRSDRPRRALELARAADRDIHLYAPDRTPCAIDLSDNTNRFGVPPTAHRVAMETVEPAITRYPTLYADELKLCLARYAGVRPEEVVTGCGSDDVLDSAIRAFSEPGEAIAFSDPTFPMLPFFARMNGLEPIRVPLTSDLDIDAAGLLAARARITYVCSPNNPTGTLASPAAIERVIERAPGLVIVDEAYAEFAGAHFAARAPGLEGVLVSRTLSKAFGLAGLRIGYATGRPELVAEVEKSRGPYKVNAIAERAAVAALTEDLAWVSAHVRETVESRARLEGALARLGLAPIPSSANFVLVPVPDAAAIAMAMRRAGVAVRPFAALPGIGDALRITVGPWAMLETALAALRGALNGTGG